MKKHLSIAATLFIATFAMLYLVHAANYRSAGFVNGRSVTIYAGSTNNTTWYATNAYSTNIILTNYQGVAVYPNSTNTLTSTNGSVITTNSLTIVPFWEIEVPNWADANGLANPNASVGVTYAGNATYTNGTTLTFVRSFDGTNYDLLNNTWTFGFTNASPYTNYTTVITNLPTVFLQGVSKIRLQSVTIATNGVSSGAITILGVNLNGFVP